MRLTRSQIKAMVREEMASLVSPDGTILGDPKGKKDDEETNEVITQKLKESTAAYEKTLLKIAKDRQLRMLSKKDKEALIKIAKLMKSANESTNEAKELDPNQDLKINAQLINVLKKAGWKVRSFKATKKGYNEIWAGKFKTKKAILSFSVDKWGSVHYHDDKKSQNIGKIDKASKLITWMKSLKQSAPWAESVNEVGRPLVNTLNHAIDDVEHLMDIVTGDQAKDAFSYPIRSTKFLKIAHKALEKVK